MPPIWCSRRPTSPSSASAAGATFFPGCFSAPSTSRGIEINPAIFEVLTDKFADFSGHLDRQPGVSLVNAEARSYINHSSDRYDLVQISLIDTWAATAAGGLTLTENRLYTVEAWGDFYRALKPGGLLSVSRWYDPDGHRGEFYRLVAIAASALQRKGVPAAELPDHVVALNVGNIVTVITRPDAFTDAAMAGCAHEASGPGLQDTAGAGCHFRRRHVDVDVRQGRRGFLRVIAGKHRPSTDDNPFFFYTARFGDLASKPLSTLSNNNAAISMTLMLIVMALCACVYYIVGPFVRLARRMPLSALTPPVTYFCAIGMGFMLIEISQMQRLMVFLGHPVYGLSVVLFTILLFSGIGSTTVGAHAPRPGAVIARVVALLTTLAVAGLLTPLLTAWARSASHRHAHSVVGTAAGAPGILHGDDVPARAEHLAPPLGTAAVLLERQRYYIDVCVRAGHGLVDRIRHRQDLRAGRRLLCRLCPDDRRKPPGGPSRARMMSPLQPLPSPRRSSQRWPNWSPASRQTKCLNRRRCSSAIVVRGLDACMTSRRFSVIPGLARARARNPYARWWLSDFGLATSSRPGMTTLNAGLLCCSLSTH